LSALENKTEKNLVRQYKPKTILELATSIFIMSQESTPLNEAAAIANSLLTKENAAHAAEYTKEQAKVLAQMMSDGNTSVRLLALMGGIAMAMTSALGVLNRFLGLNWISAIVEFYTFILGLSVVILEAKSAKCRILPERWTAAWEARIRKYALFLSFVSGRGGLYFVAGTLQLSQLSLVDLIVGGYMALVGISYIVVGKQTSQKLSDLRKSILSESVLRTKFQAADTENCGSLSVVEFQTLMSREFGIHFTSRELEVSFDHLDGVHARDGRITLEEFLEWWNECQFDEASIAQFGLSV